MIPSKNRLYSRAMQSCINYPQHNPLVVLYAYSKLLFMDDHTAESLLGEDELKELLEVRVGFEIKDIDCVLFKTGVPLILPFFDNKAYADSFAEGVRKISDETGSSRDIAEAAFHALPGELLEVFLNGNDVQSVIEYQKKLKSEKQGGSGEEHSEEDSSEEKATKKKQLPHRYVLSGETGYDEVNDEDHKNFTSLSESYRTLNKALLDVVKGQDTAVYKFVRGCFRGELFDDRNGRNTPAAYFFFFGPPGVGKTLLATTAADNMDRPSKVFDMSEFSSGSSYEQLVGFSSTYKDSQKGILTDFVRKNPKAILVFDEIEKAHISVIRLFLQILGSGKLTDAYSKKAVSFKETIIIFTSNVGRELYADRSVKLSSMPEQVILDSIAAEKNAMGEPVLPPEICSRIASGNMIIFDHLSVRQLAKMVNENFERVVSLMEKEYDCGLTYNPSLPMLFLHHRGGAIDARIAANQSESFLKDELFELTGQLDNCEGANIRSLRFDIEWEGMSNELRRLFINKDKTEVLIMGDDDVAGCFKAPKRKCAVYHAKTMEEAKKYLKHDISATFIDPRWGYTSNDRRILSISDYPTDGNELFRELQRIQTGLPVFILEVDDEFSEVDRRTYIQEGAEGTIKLSKGSAKEFSKEFMHIMDELYMERENIAFSQKGWVIDYNTKQSVSKDHQSVEIFFYDLRKTMAIDVESRDAVLKDAERPSVRFSDIIGAAKAKEELSYFIDYLKNPRQFLVQGGKPPKGVLLYGPPGTGKTMLAKAMAGESDVTFIQTSAAEFKDPYVGVSEENIRKLFQKAKRYAPAVIFIDEIDAIGKKRTGGPDASTTESMLNTLLTEMDGFMTDNKKPVFVLAATNYGVDEESDGISALDEALVRRFDNRIYVDLPTEEERKTYINKIVDARKLTGVSEQVRNNIAERTTGQSLAIIQNVVDLAFRNAVKKKKKVTDDMLLDALEEYLYGEKKERDADYYKKVAIHEVGHAYVSFLTGDKPSYITIESRGHFGGYMQHSNQEDVPEYTREELIGRIRTCLAGRAAESVFFGKEESLNTGASSDLENATNYAWSIVCRYGMEDDQLIVLKRSEILNSPLAADYVARVNAILNAEMANTVKMIQDGRKKIQSIADRLVKENKLTGKQFEGLMGKAKYK